MILNSTRLAVNLLKNQAKVKINCIGLTQSYTTNVILLVRFVNRKNCFSSRNFAKSVKSLHELDIASCNLSFYLANLLESLCGPELSALRISEPVGRHYCHIQKIHLTVIVEVARYPLFAHVDYLQYNPAGAVRPEV